MNRLLRTSVFALALGVVGVIASAQSADAGRYPENSTTYRKHADAYIKMLRSQCDAHCPPKQRERVMIGIDRMASRVVDVCADGWVTSAENDYVFAAVPPPAQP